MIKNTEEVVLKALERNVQARTSDFILYGSVLKELGIDLHMGLGQFLANAKELKAPSFETVSRCRRHIQELRHDLKDKDTATMREERQQDFVDYSRTNIA